MEYQEAREHFGNACGVITAASFRERGIPTVYLTRLVKEGVLMRVGRGLYISGQDLSGSVPERTSRKRFGEE